MKRYRIISQGIFLTFFLLLFLFTKSNSENSIFTKATYFLYFDPYIAISYILAEKKIISVLLFSIVILIPSIILGRAFCGWICPLGTLNDLMGLLNKSRNETINKNHLRYKYYLLFFSLGLAMFGINISGFIDPLSMLIRSLTITLYPFLNITVHSLYELITYLSPESEVAPKFYTFLRQYLIENNRIYFSQTILIGTIFLLILTSNIFVKRFWCKYLCPLGALLGIISRFALIKRETNECRECKLCQYECNGGQFLSQRANIYHLNVSYV